MSKLVVSNSKGVGLGGRGLSASGYGARDFT